MNIETKPSVSVNQYAGAVIDGFHRYVSSVPSRNPQYAPNRKHDVHGWGMSRDKARAIPLSPFWQHKFSEFCLHHGYAPHFTFRF